VRQSRTAAETGSLINPSKSNLWRKNVIKIKLPTSRTADAGKVKIGEGGGIDCLKPRKSKLQTSEDTEVAQAKSKSSE
jgi:hypothetical protein